MKEGDGEGGRRGAGGGALPATCWRGTVGCSAAHRTDDEVCVPRSAEGRLWTITGEPPTNVLLEMLTDRLRPTTGPMSALEIIVVDRDAWKARAEQRADKADPRCTFVDGFDRCRLPGGHPLTGWYDGHEFEQRSANPVPAEVTAVDGLRVGDVVRVRPVSSVAEDYYGIVGSITKLGASAVEVDTPECKGWFSPSSLERIVHRDVTPQNLGEPGRSHGGHTCDVTTVRESIDDVAYDLRCAACVALRISLVGPMLPVVPRTETPIPPWRELLTELVAECIGDGRDESCIVCGSHHDEEHVEYDGDPSCIVSRVLQAERSVPEKPVECICARDSHLAGLPVARVPQCPAHRSGPEKGEEKR